MLVMIKSSTKPPTDTDSDVEELASKPVEDIKPLLKLLSGSSFGEKTSIGYAVLKALTLLSRHKQNRKQFAEHDVASALSLLSNPASKIRLEAALLVRNLCYDEAKVSMAVELSGPRAILHLLRNPSEKPDSRAAAAAALQTITYRHSGRLCVLEFNGLAVILELINCKYTTLRVRAIGILRNLTVDIRSLCAVSSMCLNSLCTNSP
uniref:Armadillo repeat-containing protein 8 n=1 Tax=Lotharella globosa TaxID=91324 RepID=A0A6V3JL90_9EUKA|mmetsp:Transcript_15723/g.29679  ORF Transcript_15723/g.29679 Transcript_15723/m.29679 type:complete len:207 (+) Transcript_15723:214-834(+)